MRPKPHTTWHLDEMFVSIGGKKMYLWRAVDAEGEVLDCLVQSRRNKRAALRLMRKLIRKYRMVPSKFVTDRLPSYAAARVGLPVTVAHASLDTPEFQRQARDFAAGLEAAGKRVELIRAEHYNHFEVLETLAPVGIPCGAVLDSTEILADPHLRKRGMIVELEHPTRGTYPMPANPVRLSDSPTQLTRAPLLGEHNAEIYGEMLGYGSAEIEKLRRDRVI